MYQMKLKKNSHNAGKQMIMETQQRRFYNPFR